MCRGHVQRSQAFDQSAGVVASAALYAAAFEVAAALTCGRGVDDVERRAFGNIEQFAVILRLFDGSDDRIAVEVYRNILTAAQLQRTVDQPGAGDENGSSGKFSRFVPCVRAFCEAFAVR